MLHRLTGGHLDPVAVERSQLVPTKALGMDAVNRLLAELGEKDAEGDITLGGRKVEFKNAAIRTLGGAAERIELSQSLRYACKKNGLPHCRLGQVSRYPGGRIGGAD